jgi:hypothetical protein
VNVPLALVTEPKVLLRAMVFLLVRTVGTIKFVNVKLVIFAPEKPQTKPLVNLDRTQPKQVPSHALSVHPVRTLLCPVLVPVIIVVTMNINENPMLPNAFQ